MQAWLRFFRATAGPTSLVRRLSQSRSFGAHALNGPWNPNTTSLGSEPSTSGREVLTWSLGSVQQSLALLGGPLHTSTLVSVRGVTGPLVFGSGTSLLAPGSLWSSLVGPVRWCQKGQLSRQRVPKGAAINDNIMPNTTQLKYGLYGIRALSGKRVAANTLEAVRRTLRRKLKKTARLWVRIEATVPVTRKPLNIRMGKGKGAIAFYATAVRPGQIIYEMDRVSRTVALQAMQAAQYKFPVKLGFVEWS